jgi:hypothetical protein
MKAAVTSGPVNVQAAVGGGVVAGLLVVGLAMALAGTPAPVGSVEQPMDERLIEKALINHRAGEREYVLSGEDAVEKALIDHRAGERQVPAGPDRLRDQTLIERRGGK